MIVEDNVIKSAGLGKFFETLRKLSAETCKKWPQIRPKVPDAGTALHIGAKSFGSTVSENREAALSTFAEVLFSVIRVKVYSWKKVHR